ncbi:hypothetical protein V8E51_004870 [Hyaloscypha variabilis]
MDDPDINLFDHLDVFRQEQFGRLLLRYIPDDVSHQADMAKVFILKYTLDGLEENEQDSNSDQHTWLHKVRRYPRRLIATNSRTMHWAVEVRGDLYETFRHKEYYLPWDWRATMKMTPEKIWKKDTQRMNPLERKLVGTTALTNTEITEKTIRYSLNFRPYSIFGDNCQQFVKRFCQEIDVQFDPDASNHLRTATDIANVFLSSISLLCVLFLLDIFGNKGRFALATSVHAGLALITMVLLTFSHPRMFLLDVAYLGFNISHFIHLLVSTFVWFLWVLVAAVLCFSFERECDLVAVRIVNGEEVFDIWHPCNVFLRLAQLSISIVCLLGAIYHSYYSSHFIQE